MSNAWRVLNSIRLKASGILPNAYILNYAIAAPLFWRGNRRLPRNPASPAASINDYIFATMIRNDWTTLQRTCVDKEYAKTVALGLSGDVKVPRTLSVRHIDSKTTPEELAEWLEPFLGKHAVAKPTHSSGFVLFLDQTVPQESLVSFLEFSKKSLFPLARETQYTRLERKIIIEENVLPPGEHSVDYKFYCSHGIVHYCQVEVDRFSRHRRVICTVPEFRPLQVRHRFDLPDRVEVPKHLGEMLAVAGRLSASFDFVRVDLYDTEEGVYFSEFTFTPASGAHRFSDEGFAIELLRKVRLARDARRPPSP